MEKKGLDPDFRKKLDEEFYHLWSLYSVLYGSRFDFLYQLEDLVSLMAIKYSERPPGFSSEDKKRDSSQNWFLSRKSVGVMLYVDLFNFNLKGIEEKLDYFCDLGVNVVHLMPLFKSPNSESDGGYAVSDYQKVDKSLGSMSELSKLAELMRSRGIVLILDFILNHTSDEHQWAQKAISGDEEYQGYYYMFDSREKADSYDRYLREIFPTVRKGSFTFNEPSGRWIWTTFNSFQWDLNYSNPDLFRAMCEQMLFLANHGAEVLRLDALAFSWKEKGSPCENLPKAHTLIKAFRSVAKISAPALVFLSEAIVHPDEVINYISEDECELSYNPLLMATSWEALATRNTDLLKKTFSSRFDIPNNCKWVNYIRCHDDIGWTFCDEDAASLNINAHDHRRFLNGFYTGRFPGSFAKGVPFQENTETGDARISGTLASLAGLEQAIKSENPEELDMALKRIKMLLGFPLSLPGLPLLYSGDELGVLNNYNYLNNEKHRGDSRWLHRSHFPWKSLDDSDENIVALKLYHFVKRMIKLRSKVQPMEGSSELMKLENSNVLGLKLTFKKDYLLVLVNFTERISRIKLNSLRLYGGCTQYNDLVSQKDYSSDFDMDSYQIMWLKGRSI